ncbi:hypothetical protein ACP4OV_024038 [Aristida adscensionis]
MESYHEHIYQGPPCSYSSPISAAGLSCPLPPQAGLPVAAPPQAGSPVAAPPPPACYTCGYCKREFKSPQGLGGHMNVHRWDRARLIQRRCSSQQCHLASPPPLNHNSTRRVLDHHRRLGLSLLPHCAAVEGGGSPATASVCRFASVSTATTARAAKEFFEVRTNLDLGFGACSHGDDTEDRLDLQLRLGCS